jgi:ABC-type arginine/histidine transport system permease subunit
MFALLLGWMAFTTMRMEGATFNLRVLAVSLAIGAVYSALHLVMSSRARKVNRWLGAVAVIVPIILLFASGGPLVQSGVLIYVGLSSLLQSLRGDGSCEVLAIPSVMFKPATHLAGILFAPIDAIEKHMSGPGGLPG